ncbi:hypothetical protein CYMTET_4520 [Cymbomonas tetramitiformis]|uniref:Ubiquitin-like domain-containing protein n=1 Tax=Cymbomonas tetramitiformis TaxID=36881 RepID=A0AAE0H161_9CHLO|nr:hypothetical protein CYMTET_4520 [Cymbomonas tetramitiformis]
MSLVPLDGLLAGTAGACASEIVAAMYNHDSLVPLGIRLLRNKAYVRYAREDYACKRGRSPEWLVSFVIFNYLEFMAVLADNRTDNAYRRFLPPPVVDVVWHEHLLDTFGYPAFCIDVVGGMLHRYTDQGLSQNRLHRISRIMDTISAYGRVPHGQNSINRLVQNGMWWYELTPPHAKAPPSAHVAASPPAAQVGEKANSSNKRARRVPEEDVEVDVEGGRNAPFNVRVKLLATGQLVTCDVNEDSTMHDVAEHAATAVGCDCDQLKLVCEGKLYYGAAPTSVPCGGKCGSKDALMFYAEKCIIEHKEQVMTLKQLAVDNGTVFHQSLKLGGWTLAP